MRKVGSLAALLVLVGCGRIGFDDVDPGPTPLIAEESIATPPFGLAARAEGDGFVAVFGHLGPAEDVVEVVLVETDASGRPVGELLSVSPASGWLSMASVFSGPEGYGVFYEARDVRALEAVSLSPAGDILRQATFSGWDAADVTPTDDGYAVAYRERNSEDIWELRLQRLDSSLTVIGPPSAPVPATAHQDHPHVAFSDGALGILWLDRASNPGVARLVAVDSAGTPIYSPLEVGGEWVRGIVADGAGGFVVAAETPEETHVLRFDAAGAIVWDAPVALPRNLRNSQDFSMARSDSLLAYAWQSDDQGAIPSVDGASLEVSDGAPSLGRQVLADPSAGARLPVVAANEGRFAAVFDQTNRNRRGPFIRVFGP